MYNDNNNLPIKLCQQHDKNGKILYQRKTWYKQWGKNKYNVENQITFEPKQIGLYYIAKFKYRPTVEKKIKHNDENY